MRSHKIRCNDALLLWLITGPATGLINVVWIWLPGQLRSHSIAVLNNLKIKENSPNCRWLPVNAAYRRWCAGTGTGRSRCKWKVGVGPGSILRAYQSCYTGAGFLLAAAVEWASCWCTEETGYPGYCRWWYPLYRRHAESLAARRLHHHGRIYFSQEWIESLGNHHLAKDVNSVYHVDSEFN